MKKLLVGMLVVSLLSCAAIAINLEGEGGYLTMMWQCLASRGLLAMALLHINYFSTIVSMCQMTTGPISGKMSLQ